MSDQLNDDETETLVKDKSNARRERRSSVQFIDKNLIRRRSSGNEKPTTQQRIVSFEATQEKADLDHLQHYSETFSNETNNRVSFYFCFSCLQCFLFNSNLKLH